MNPFWFWSDCKNGKLKEAKEALEAGADPNTVRRKMTCLMAATLHNRAEMVALLLSQPGIDVNAKDDQGNTAFHVACYKGNVAILRLFLDAPGMLHNERNNLGETPILRAIKFVKIEAVRLMAEVAEVDLDVTDNQGRSLEEFAIKNLNNRWVVLDYAQFT